MDSLQNREFSGTLKSTFDLFRIILSIVSIDLGTALKKGKVGFRYPDFASNRFHSILLWHTLILEPRQGSKVQYLGYDEGQRDIKAYRAPTSQMNIPKIFWNTISDHQL